MDGIESKLLKPIYILNNYFIKETEELKTLESQRENLVAQQEELAEEHIIFRFCK